MSQRQHYVSRFHLSHFTDPLSNNEPSLWVGDIQSHKVKRRAPKNIGWARNVHPEAVSQPSFEKFLAERVESQAAATLTRQAGVRGVLHG